MILKGWGGFLKKLKNKKMQLAGCEHPLTNAPLKLIKTKSNITKVISRKKN